MFKRAIIVITTLLSIFSQTIHAQPQGLIFSAFEVAQEKRTSLDITPGGPLCLSGRFDLSFRLSFLPNRTVYFGYVFRMLNKHRQNIDLVYSQQEGVFSVIAGEALTGIRFRIDREQLHGRWNTFRLRVDDGQLSCYVNGQLAGKAAVILQDDCFRIIFGACPVREFRSTDLPPMQLSDVALTVNGRLKYCWPLREPAGTTVRDSLQRQRAVVSNPVWAADRYTHWEPLLSRRVSGCASIAFDSTREELYIIAKDSIYRFAMKDRATTVTGMSAAQHHLLPGNRSFFHPQTRTLYNFFIDQRAIAMYQPEQRRWAHPIDTADVTAYWHANTFFSPAQNALYIMGGYGQLRYKNTVFRYRFADSVWETLSPQGDFFTPRYLAALGATAGGDTAYVLGGYGSTTGRQILNPRYRYDLLRFDVKQQSFKKLYTLPLPASSFVFANNMVLDTGGHFYALTFPNDRFNTRLQLIKGSLREPAYTAVGDTIPYNFRDNRSYAGLFQCPGSKLLLAVTLYRVQEEETAVALYSIAFPPEAITTPPLRPLLKYRWAAFLAAMLLLGLYGYFRLRRAKLLRQGVANAALPAAPPALPAAAPAELSSPPASIAAVHPAVLLFGNFTVTDRSGNDISHLFTPLLKELFLLITIYTVKHGQGISPENLHGILWNDKSGEAAKNNRAVNMRKLKNILEQLGAITLRKESGKWTLQYPPGALYIDLVAFLQLPDHCNDGDLQTLRHLLHIVRKGAFLYQTEYEWLDDIKSDISNQVLDRLLQAAASLSPDRDAALLISIADGIFCFDAVNEQALRLKCSCLVALGRHALARNVYGKFEKEYRYMYGEAFPLSFNDIIVKAAGA